MNNFFLVFRNTSFLVLSGILIKFSGLLWILYLAPPDIERFGRYNFVHSFIGIFSFLPDFGVGLIVIREIAKNKKNIPLILGNAFILNSFLSLITLFLISILAFFLGYSLDIQILLFLAALTLLVSTIRSVAVYYFDGMEKMEYSAFFNTLNTIFSLGGAFIGERSGGLVGVFIGLLIGTLLCTILNWIVLLKWFTIPKFSYSEKMVKHLFLEGLPLGLAAFAALIYSRIDSVILHSIAGERAVGLYSAATPFPLALIQLLNVPFMVAVFPALTRIAQDKEKFVSHIKKSLGIILLWSIPASLFFFFFADYITLLFGDKYTEAIPLLRVVIWFVPFAALSALLYKILIIINKQYVYLGISIITALINIILNVLLIPRFGEWGASISNVLTQAIMFMIYALVVIILLKQYHPNENTHHRTKS